MNKKIKMIDDVEIEKRNFQRIKYLSFLKHVDVDNILISSKDFLEKKIIGTLLVTQMVILMMIVMIIKLNHFV